MKEQQGFTEEQELHAPTGKPTLRSFGNYDLVRRIDVGGMGEVYLAHQRTAFGREVAVKIIRSDLVYDVTARKRFQREAEVSAYLKHDHILPLLEYGEEQGRLFLVTPYIKGGTLAHRLRRGPLPLNEINQLFTALVEAVGYLHRRAVIHRDLKPSNILLDQAEDNGRVYVRLIDFGIASLQGGQASAPLTVAGQEMGTAAYMAPERLDGVAAPSNDIYSLGIILFQMITGKLPSETPHVRLPEPLAYVIQHCVAANPADRFDSADDLLQAFAQAYQAVRQSIPAQEVVPLAQTDPASTLPTATPAPIPSIPAEEARDDAGARPTDSTQGLKEQNAHDSFVQPSRSSTSSHPVLPRAGTGPQPALPRQNTGSQPAVARQNTGAQPVLPRAGTGPQPALARHSTGSRSAPGRAATGERPAPSRPEIILPPLPGKNESFSGSDYDAPTSYVDPEQSKKQRLSASATIGAKVQPQRHRAGKRPIPIMLVISLAMVLILAMIAAIGYTAFQATTIATISLMPRTQALSEVFTLTAKVNAQTDVASATIPAAIFTSQQSSSLEGQTSGKTDCTLGIFNCKQSVSEFDVLMLSSQIRPTLEDQIKQDLQKRAQAAGALTASDIGYNTDSITPDPQVGTVSKTVKVTMTMTGSQEYVKASDARNLARALLKQKLKKDYTLIDSMVQIGSPVVQSVDASGTVKLAIAAAGVGQYHIPQSELTRLQDQIKGKKVTDARALLAKLADMDPAALNIRVTAGDTIPNDIQQIKFNILNPSNLPRVQLTPVPTNGPSR